MIIKKHLAYSSILAIILTIAYFNTSQPKNAHTVSATSEVKPFITDEEDLQEALKLARQGDLHSVEKVAVWYQLRGMYREAKVWEQRSDEIRIKHGLPTKAELRKRGLPQSPGYFQKF